MQANCLITEEILGPRRGLPGNVTITDMQNYTMSRNNVALLRIRQQSLTYGSKQNSSGLFL